VNRGQDGADQHYQQVDFHVSLRCTIAAVTATLQKAFRLWFVPAYAMTVA
jgi:hypothetical protein